jgi:bacterioferritin
MKGNEKLLEKLNDLLSDELTAVNQYMVHAEMDDNWAYTAWGICEKRAIDEMKHAEQLISRILFLEGTPVVSNLKKIMIGSAVEKQLANDWDAEFGRSNPITTASNWLAAWTITAPSSFLKLS